MEIKEIFTMCLSIKKYGVWSRKNTVTKRIGEPEDIGQLILFLIDNRKSAFITGQSFVADGGALAQLSTEVS
jgi:NAD(P)-dependent dehydrogenase (short-subunit alcohol dehydrogenase family)